MNILGTDALREEKDKEKIKKGRGKDEDDRRDGKGGDKDG